MKRYLKQLGSLLCILSLVLGLLPTAAFAADGDGNLLTNSSFETGTKTNLPGWTLTGGAGQQSNNPHTGGKGFYLDGGAGNRISQAVTVPYSGIYLNSAYISTGGPNAVYAVKAAGGAALTSITLPGGATYAAPHILMPVELCEGNSVEVYVSGGSGWVNGDDLYFGYDFSQVFYNLLTGVSLMGGGSAAVRLPWTGNYNFRADITATTQTTVTVGDQHADVETGETQTIELTVSGQSKDDVLAISVSGDCEITGASLTLDISSIPNEKPVALDVESSGVLHSGQALVGSYTFSDTDSGQGGREGNSTFCWLASDTEDGDYAAIAGETGKTLVLTDEQEGQFIKFEVTPVDGYGLAGDPVRSDPVGPVVINYVRNPSLDIEKSQQPEGWSSRNGGTMPNSSAAACNGFRFARIPANDADAEVYYALTLPKTANYRAGAYVKTTSALGALGVRTSTGEVLALQGLPDTSGAYQFIELPLFAAERDTKVEFFLQGAEGCAQIDADDFQILYDGIENLPEFAALHSFSVEKQTSRQIDSEHKTISILVPYGTDVTALKVTAAVSDGAAITPASGETVDFSNPVVFTISNGNTQIEWTVTVTVGEKRLVLSSDNKTLEEGFNWAVQKTDQFVMTGVKDGPVNVPQTSGQTANYIPSYWAGYYDRTAFYSRDFVHQAVGAQIVGLWDENWSMFKTFAGFASFDRKWYTGWAFNFDGSIYTMDYKSDTNFVREVPAQFELVEKAYKQYLWSGDRRYIEDPVMWNFYTRVMNDFVAFHDSNGNGVAEGTGGGIFAGSCTYNERGGQPIIEAGDAIGSQYQATLAYAAMLKERGQNKASELWYEKAAALKRYFNEEWSVIDPDQPGAPYARALSTDRVTKYNDFGKENSWFMPMKLITEPGERNDAYLDFISDQVGDHIGHKSNSPNNIEAWTYLPDTYFPYNRTNDAWKYMKYIISIKDDPHERPIQGTNGDYPEISYTFLTHTIEGMMGMEADAYNHKVATAPRLPDEVGNVEVKYIHMGEHIIDLAHDGLAKSTLSNDSAHDLTWEIRFYGTHKGVLVNGTYIAAQQKDVNGVTVSYVTATVPAGGTADAQATDTEPVSPPPVSGGGAPSTTTTETRKNEDGSTTTTMTDKKTGTVTETTTWPDGTKLVTVTDKNGARASEVTVPSGKDSVTVIIPTAQQPGPGQVAVLVKPDGTREIIRRSVSTKNGMRVTLTEGAKLEIVDNAKTFIDVAPQDWFGTSVQFVTSRELFAGTGAEIFSPNAPMSRAMLMTVLARLDGQDTAEGENWYAVGMEWAKTSGVSDGTNLEASITREQLAVMLYRYAKVGKADGNLTAFPDAGNVSGWAAEAMAWAVKHGIITGTGAEKLDPTGIATRAEVAAMLQRFISLP